MPFSLSFLLLCGLGVGRQTEKGGVPRWWCTLFFPLPTAYRGEQNAKHEGGAPRWRLELCDGQLESVT